MLSYSETRPAVWAMDAAEAGPNGDGGRPPANEDGTPVGIDMLFDVFVIVCYRYSSSL